MKTTFKKSIRRIGDSKPGVWLMRLARIWPIVIHFGPSLSYAPRWLLRSREWTNFTYDYTALGNAAAFEAVALATSRPVTEIEHYAMEILNDEELKQWIEHKLPKVLTASLPIKK